MATTWKQLWAELSPKDICRTSFCERFSSDFLLFSPFVQSCYLDRLPQKQRWHLHKPTFRRFSRKKIKRRRMRKKRRRRKKIRRRIVMKSLFFFLLCLYFAVIPEFSTRMICICISFCISLPYLYISHTWPNQGDLISLRPDWARIYCSHSYTVRSHWSRTEHKYFCQKWTNKKLEWKMQRIKQK